MLFFATRLFPLGFEGKRATYVHFVQKKVARSVRATREIILSAGAFASPAILMRSGIGDAENLRQLGIDVVHHAPQVGRNLRDHISSPVQYSSPTTIPYGISWRTMPWLAWSVVEYALFRRGLFANTILHAGGFVKTRPGLDRPDVQFILMPADRRPDGRMGIGHGYGLITILLRPKSSGSVRLADANPASAPIIDPRFYDDPGDLDDMVRGLRLARRLLEAPAWKPARGEEIRPGSAVQTDEELIRYLREFSVTCFHPVGTCRMGPTCTTSSIHNCGCAGSSAARRGCVDHAEHDRRQYKRTGNHDCRESCRHISRPLRQDQFFVSETACTLLSSRRLTDGLRMT